MVGAGTAAGDAGQFVPHLIGSVPSAINGAMASAPAAMSPRSARVAADWRRSSAAASSAPLRVSASTSPATRSGYLRRNASAT